MPDRRKIVPVDDDEPVTSAITTPTPNGPAMYGTPEFAEAIAPVWGMSEQDALALMQHERGDVSLQQIQIYDQIKQLEEADRLKKAQEKDRSNATEKGTKPPSLY